MDAFKISMKLFVDRSDVPPHEFVPVFHRWIQKRVLPDLLLIDVADYAHVPDGPGTLLVAHEANLGMDNLDGKLGLLYVRKTPMEGTFADRLTAIAHAMLNAAALMEDEPALAGKLTFRTNEIELKIVDRLLAPATAETFDAVKGDLQTLADRLFAPHAAKVEQVIDPRKMFTVRLTSPSTESLRTLCDRVAQPAV